MPRVGRITENGLSVHRPVIRSSRLVPWLSADSRLTRGVVAAESQGSAKRYSKEEAYSSYVFSLTYNSCRLRRTSVVTLVYLDSAFRCSTFGDRFRHRLIHAAPESPLHPPPAGRTRTHAPESPPPSPAPPQTTASGKACHQRGSKTLSDTNAIRRGISSSRNVAKASSVSRTCASSSTAQPHARARAMGLPLLAARARPVRPARRPSNRNLCTAHDSPRNIEWSQRCLQQIQRRIQPRFHGRNRATQDLRHFFELESLVNLQQHRLALIFGQPPQRAFHRQRQLDRQQRRARTRSPGSIGISPSGFRSPQQRKRLVMRDPEQPRREPRRIVEFGQVLIRFQKNVLAKIHRIFAIRNQPQQIIEDTLLPSGHEKVIGLHVSLPRFGDQVAIFNLAKDQLSGSVRKDAGIRKKVELTLNFTVLWGRQFWRQPPFQAALRFRSEEHAPCDPRSPSAPTTRPKRELSSGSARKP